MWTTRSLPWALAALLIGCSEMPAPRLVRTDYAAGGSFTDTVLAADFNGDGIVDLQASNWSANNVGILLGVGDATFAAAVTHDVVSEPGAAAAADFNGDGLVDLAVPNVASKTSTVGHTVSLFFGSAGGVIDAVALTVDGGPAAAEAGDVNGDGRADLVLVHSTNEVSVFLGNGDGTFGNSWTLRPSDVVVNAVALADLDGDGDLDLALTADAADYSGRGSVLTCLGNGDGTFANPSVFAAGLNATSIAVADFNHDGSADIAVVNEDNEHRTGYAVVLLGNGDGTLRSPVSHETGWGAQAIRAADLNGDGRPDLVVADNFVADVAVLLGRGDGTFQAAAHYPSTFGVRALAIADFDRDGRLDIAAAVAQSDMVSIFHNGGAR